MKRTSTPAKKKSTYCKLVHGDFTKIQENTTHKPKSGYGPDEYCGKSDIPLYKLELFHYMSCLPFHSLLSSPLV